MSEETEGQLTDREGQGSDLLRQLAKIELQAAVGNALVKRVGERFSDHALSSPGNLRLCRTLLANRTADEMGFAVVAEDVEDWIVEDADDGVVILELWNLLLDAEQSTILEGVLGGPKVWDAGRSLAVKEIGRVFEELEIKLGSYQVVHKVQGKHLSEEIVPEGRGDGES